MTGATVSTFQASYGLEMMDDDDFEEGKGILKAMLRVDKHGKQPQKQAKQKQ